MGLSLVDKQPFFGWFNFVPVDLPDEFGVRVLLHNGESL